MNKPKKNLKRSSIVLKRFRKAKPRARRGKALAGNVGSQIFVGLEAFSLF
jgi:hypothetical protein